MEEPIKHQHRENPHNHQHQHQQHNPDHPHRQQQNSDHPHQQQHKRHHHPLWFPRSRKTNPFFWFLGVLCAIFWVIVVIAGLLTLIIYLVFRPRSPHLEIPSATLNGLYIDTGFLLNADLTILTNFSNPNKKVDIRFHYMVLNLYFENTLIAARSIDPFALRRGNSNLQAIHMISSEVYLQPGDAEKLVKQVENNTVALDIKGYFRTRSDLGSFTHFMYWLYGRCSVVLSGPPSGVLLSQTCRTKR